MIEKDSSEGFNLLGDIGNSSSERKLEGKGERRKYDILKYRRCTENSPGTHNRIVSSIHNHELKGR